MSSYKVTFTPVEPWFFGNEKTFLFPNDKKRCSYSNSYYIKSEFMPSQSTILGALRYILIPNKKPKYQYSEDDIKANVKFIGPESFNVDSAEKQSFGKIKTVSPVFVVKDGETLISAPLNHKKFNYNEDKTKSENEQYTPFADYCVCENTSRGKMKMVYPADYNSKDGLFSGFVSLADGKVYENDDIFLYNERTGNNRKAKEDGFFKKGYAFFKKLDDNKTPHKYSFAVYADIDDDTINGKTEIVTLGQGKSPFAVSFTQQENTLESEVEAFFEKCAKPTVNEEHTDKYKFIYCLSDAFVSSPYDKTVFAITQTKDYRSYLSGAKGKVQKGSELHRLVKAGSVFVTENTEEWKENNSSPNAEQIGYNCFIETGGKK